MTTNTNRLLVLLLDAFDYRYLAAAEYLQSFESRPLAAMPGYAGVAASMFTGRWPAEHGLWNLFHYRPTRFWWSRLFRLYGTLSPSIYKVLWRRGRDFYVKSKAPPTRPYAYLHPTIFDIMRERCSFLYYSHPWWCSDQGEHIIWRSYSDSSVLARVKSKLNQYDFVFLHLYALDHVGHRFGPRVETLEYVRNLDQALKDFLPEWNDQVLILSDHGMDAVTHIVDVSDRIASGEVYFLDSVLARLWYPSQETLSRLTELNGGRFFTKEEMALYVPDAECATHVWCGTSGTLIVPCEWGNQPVQGMHGYLDGADGILLADFPLPKARYQAVDVFDLMLQVMGLENTNT